MKRERLGESARRRQSGFNVCWKRERVKDTERERGREGRGETLGESERQTKRG